MGEVNNLFKNIFTAIDVHTDTLSVNKGLDDLAVQISDLEAKLLAVTRERDSLLDSVHDLRAEKRQLCAKLLPTMQPVPPFSSYPGVKHRKDNQEDEIRVLKTDLLKKSKPIPQAIATGKNVQQDVTSNGNEYPSPLNLKKGLEQRENTFVESESDDEKMISSEDESGKEDLPPQQKQEYRHDSDDNECSE